MTMILVLIALVLFAFAAAGIGSVGRFQFVPAGLFCWLLATTHETLRSEAGDNLVVILLIVLLVAAIVFVVNRTPRAQ